MSASGDKLYGITDADPIGETTENSRIVLTSPLIAYSVAALGSIAIWIGIFKLVFG